MIALIVLVTTAVAPMNVTTALSCDGIRVIEAAAIEHPRAFASLSQQDKTFAYVRNGAGQRVRQEVSVTNVKTIAGFTRCRYVVSAQVDLACYVGASLADRETNAIAEMLTSTAEALGHCLTNRNLVRGESEPGSTSSISFGGGARQPFWQVSMVPVQDDFSRVQPEILVLGPALDEEPVSAALTARTSLR